MRLLLVELLVACLLVITFYPVPSADHFGRTRIPHKASKSAGTKPKLDLSGDDREKLNRVIYRTAWWTFAAIYILGLLWIAVS